MAKKLHQLNLGALLLSVPAIVQAETIGSLSENLLGPTALVTQLLVYACYIVGLIFCFMAIAQYKVHRESPKLVPLSTPVMFVLFGLILILLPYFSKLFKSGSALQYKQEQGIQDEGHQGLALPPLDVPRKGGPGDFSRSPRDSEHKMPSRQTPASKPSPDSGSKGYRHWGDEPEYQ